MNKKITLETLKRWGVCIDCFKMFRELFPEGADLKTASEGLVAEGEITWSNWLWKKCANSSDDEFVKQCTATAGDWGTATAGYKGTATAGDWGTATAGYEGTAIAGYKGTATAGNWGTATAGYEGTATAGYKGTATAGDCGTAIAGDEGTATAGDCGTAIAGDEGTATAGYEGIIIISYWDSKKGKIGRKMSFVGGGGLKPNTPYRLDENLEFVEA